MSRLPQEINIEDLPQSEYGLVPNGDYTAVVDEATVNTTKRGDGHYFKLKIRITGPTHAGQNVFCNLNYDLPNSLEAQRIGRQQLAQLMKSIGIKRFSDTDELLNKPFIATVGTDPAHDGYDASNVIKKFKPADGAAPSRPAAPTAPTASTIGPGVQETPSREQAADAPVKPMHRPW